MITQFVLNMVLHHVGLSWRKSSNKHMEYYIEENILDQFDKGRQYKTAIYSKLHGTMFEDYTRNDITDRYNLMCSKTAHDKILTTYVNDASSGGSRVITENSTTEAI